MGIIEISPDSHENLAAGLHTWETNDDFLNQVTGYSKVLVVDGFPRQANTTLNIAFYNAFKNNEDIAITGRTHTLTAISLELANTHLVTSIRNPLDTMASWLIKMSAEKNFVNGTFSDGHINFVSAHFDKYIKMLEYIVSRDKSTKTIIKFEDVIARPEEVVNLVASKVDIEPVDKPLNSEELMEDMVESFGALGGINPEAWSRHGYYPRERVSSYEATLRILKTSIFIGEMSRAESLYQEALTQSENFN